MRVAFAVALLMLVVAPALTRSDPSASPVSGASSEVRWAEFEAQSRISDGDYDGAVEAEQQAQADRQQAERREMPAGNPKR